MTHQLLSKIFSFYKFNDIRTSAKRIYYDFRGSKTAPEPDQIQASTAMTWEIPSRSPKQGCPLFGPGESLTFRGRLKSGDTLRQGSTYRNIQREKIVDRIFGIHL